MDHTDLFSLRERYNHDNILLCFNGPFSQGLIEEIGSALKRYMQSEESSSSAARDVFAAYVEIAQNIRNYSSDRGYAEGDSSATVVISRDAEGRFVIAAGNVVEADDGEALVGRIRTLAAMDKTELKAVYKERLRAPRRDGDRGAGLGLIDVARRASAPFSCSLRAVPPSSRCFFSLRVVI